jgi:hypothetical protein
MRLKEIIVLLLLHLFDFLLQLFSLRDEGLFLFLAVSDNGLEFLLQIFLSGVDDVVPFGFAVYLITEFLGIAVTHVLPEFATHHGLVAVIAIDAHVVAVHLQVLKRFINRVEFFAAVRTDVVFLRTCVQDVVE